MSRPHRYKGGRGGAVRKGEGWRGRGGAARKGEGQRKGAGRRGSIFNAAL